MTEKVRVATKEWNGGSVSCQISIETSWNHISLVFFIVRLCNVGLKFIAGQNGVSTDAPLWQNSCSNQCVRECMSKLKDRSFGQAMKLQSKENKQNIYRKRVGRARRAAYVSPLRESDQRSSGQYEVWKINLLHPAEWMWERSVSEFLLWMCWSSLFSEKWFDLRTDRWELFILKLTGETSWIWGLMSETFLFCGLTGETLLFWGWQAKPFYSEVDRRNPFILRLTGETSFESGTLLFWGWQVKLLISDRWTLLFCGQQVRLLISDRWTLLFCGQQVELDRWTLLFCGQ